MTTKSDKVKNGGLDGGITKSQDAEEDLRCGIKSCKPSCLQVFNNPKAFLAWLCCFAFVQGFVVNGINNVNTTTIERRFSLPSSQVGLISSAYDVSAGLLVIPIAYFGNFGHQPRILAFGLFILAIGSFVMTLPHFTSGPYQMGNSVTDNCIELKNTTADSCSVEQGNLTSYLYVFLLGQLLHGVGGTILYSLGYVFLDGNVETSSSPMYQGIMNAFAALGPAAGFLAGGQFLNIFYVDFDVVDSASLGITPTDPRWAGAWWLGFLISSIAGFLVTLLFIGYAKELPQAKAVRATRVSQAHQNGGEDVVSKEGFGRSIKDMPTAAKYLLTNPTFMFVTLGGVTEGITLSGFATFISKFIQNQFDQTAGTAAVLGGLVAVPGAAGGQLLGGVIVRCAHLKVRGMIRLCVGLCLTCAVMCLVLLVNCGVTDIVGVSRTYENSSISLTTPDLEVSCNTNCSCSTETYEPVCGANNRQYFTPCHAGCINSATSQDSKVYGNCSCISTSSTNSSLSQAAAGPCDTNCMLLPVFLVGSFFVILLTLMASVPALNISLRCVPHSQRAFGIGIQWVFVRFLGTVPGPILFGAIFDGTCALWQTDCNQQQGSCWIYDNSLLSRNLAVFALSIKCVSALFFGIALFLYKAPASECSTSAMINETTADEKTRNAADHGIDNLAIELDTIDRY